MFCTKRGFALDCCIRLTILKCTVILVRARCSWLTAVHFGICLFTLVLCICGCMFRLCLEQSTWASFFGLSSFYTQWVNVLGPTSPWFSLWTIHRPEVTKLLPWLLIIFSKICHCVIFKKLLTKEFTSVFSREAFCLHGLPKEMVLYRISQIVSRFWGAFCPQLGTQLSFSLAYHLQSNGAADCFLVELHDYNVILLSWIPTISNTPWSDQPSLHYFN